MRRHSRRKPAINVSLFPFLAVLICTMGALVVLLVIVVQQARVEANVVSDEQLEEQMQQVEAVEDAEWRLEMLTESQSGLREQLKEERLRLAGIETHIRKLKDELVQLEQQAIALQQPLDADQVNRQNLGQQLARIRSEIQARQQQIEALRGKLVVGERSYAIMAYEGPHGTRRRPVFIECQTDRVIIQPEGIVFTAQDLSGPQGPGNPLASALRAVREYLDIYDPDALQGEPYPLLIVRPGGAEAFIASRRAMKSWDSEFGYELVDDDKKLAYPPADTALAQLLEETVENARRRRIILARAAPSRFGGGNAKSGMVLSADGGFVRQNGQRRGRRGDGWRKKPGFGFGNDASFQGEMDGGEASRDDRLQGTDQPAAPTTVEQSQQDARSNQESGKVGGNASAVPSVQGASGPSGSAMSTGMASMAESRGKDWATPAKTRGAIGFTRPIRIGCFPDRVVIHSERGENRPPRVVPIHDSSRLAVEEFVSQVWSHMESWGIAGRQAYWKPILEFEVAPGGEQRFQELKSLLDESGMEVQRKVQ